MFRTEHQVERSWLGDVRKRVRSKIHTLLYYAYKLHPAQRALIVAIRPHKLNLLFIVTTFSIFHAGERSLFIIHCHFLYHCEPRPSLKGRGLPLTGNAKVKGHACSLHSVERAVTLNNEFSLCGLI